METEQEFAAANGGVYKMWFRGAWTEPTPELADMIASEFEERARRVMYKNGMNTQDLGEFVDEERDA